MKCKICLGNTEIIKKINNVNVLECEDCKFIFYDKLPKSYDDLYVKPKRGKHYKNLKKEKFFKTVLTPYIEKNMTFLDIGCATGLTVKVVNDLGGYGYGIDLDPDLIEWGKKIFKLDTLYVNNIEESKFKDNFFDLIFMNQTIEHVYDLEKCLNEIKRILRKNGKLIIICPNFARSFKKEIIGGDHVNYFNNQNMIKLMGMHNFKVIKNPKTKKWKYNWYYRLNYMFDNEMNFFQIWLTFKNEK